MYVTADPHDIERLVVLAFQLEATYPKDACTSRFSDVGPKQRFEDFLVSAVNSGRYFHQLAERIAQDRAQPRVIYDLAYEAMMAGQQLRQGKIVNYGLIEAMFPVVVSRLVRGRSGAEALAAVPDVLKQTSQEDVASVSKMRKVIYSRSDKAFKREFPFHEAGRNVFEHYEHHRTIAHDASRLFVTELMEGMPLTGVMLAALEQGACLFGERVQKGFHEARLRSKLPAGALADFAAAAIFLYLIDHRADKIV